MGEKIPLENLFAVTYCGSPAMLGEVESIMASLNVPFLRDTDGANLYVVVHLGMGEVLRKLVREASLRHMGDILQIRWCMANELMNAPDVSYVRDGNYIYPQASDVSIAWTGPWPPLETRLSVNAALEELFLRLEGIPGMENAFVTLQVGEAQARAASRAKGAGVAPDPRDAAEALHNEYFMRLLEQHQ